MDIIIKTNNENSGVIQKIVTYAIVLGCKVNLTTPDTPDAWANKYIDNGQLKVKKAK